MDNSSSYDYSGYVHERDPRDSSRVGAPRQSVQRDVGYDRDRAASPDGVYERPAGTRRPRPEPNYRERESGNMSRERIVRSYAAQDAQRARNARMYSQEASMAYKESAARARERAAVRESLDARRREEEALRAAQRAAQREAESAQARSTSDVRGSERLRARSYAPLSTQESQERARFSQENHERARAQRDALSARRRTSNREVIDGRGSIDSRAFNEHNELVGYSVDERDKPDPYLDTTQAKTRWRSRGEGDPSVSAGLSGGSYLSGEKRGFISDLPFFVKVAVPIIIILIIILVFIFK